MSEGLAKFKIPEQIVIWDALPKNDAGKILKHQIRATLTAGASDGGTPLASGGPTHPEGRGTTGRTKVD